MSFYKIFWVLLSVFLTFSVSAQTPSQITYIFGTGVGNSSGTGGETTKTCPKQTDACQVSAGKNADGCDIWKSGGQVCGEWCCENNDCLVGSLICASDCETITCDNVCCEAELPYCENSVCVACLGNAGACAADGECCSGLCENSVCVACLGNAGACAANGECCSGSCFNGVCQDTTCGGSADHQWNAMTGQCDCTPDFCTETGGAFKSGGYANGFEVCACEVEEKSCCSRPLCNGVCCENNGNCCGGMCCPSGKLCRDEGCFVDMAEYCDANPNKNKECCDYLKGEGEYFGDGYAWVYSTDQWYMGGRQGRGGAYGSNKNGSCEKVPEICNGWDILGRNPIISQCCRMGNIYFEPCVGICVDRDGDTYYGMCDPGTYPNGRCYYSEYNGNPYESEECCGYVGIWTTDGRCCSGRTDTPDCCMVEGFIWADGMCCLSYWGGGVTGPYTGTKGCCQAYGGKWTLENECYFGCD